MATSTPWGASQSVHKYAHGITGYTTASHGGIKVCATKNAEVPECLRSETGWYEEDCAWSAVAWTFPDLFRPDEVESARATVKAWYPDAYEALTGRVLGPGESYVKDQRTWEAEHANDYQVISALGNRATGMVTVECARGGRPKTGRSPKAADCKTFLIPKGEYTGGHWLPTLGTTPEIPAVA